MTTRRWIVAGRLLLTAFALVIFAAFQDVLTAAGPSARIGLIAGALVFIPLWIWFWWSAVDARQSAAPVIAVCLLTLVLAFLTYLAPPGRDGLVLAALAAGAAFEARRAAVVVTGIAVLAAGVQLLHGTHPFTAAGGAIDDLVVGAAGIAGRLLLVTNRELALARDRVAELAVAEERLRFARDLHDLLGQDLTLAVMQSELVARDLPPAAQARQSEVSAAIRRALDDVRAAAAGYRQLDLGAEVDAARAALGAAGIDAGVEASVAELPPTVAGVLAWALRESVTNVIRHSGARRCTVGITSAGGLAQLAVEDDGAGEGLVAAGGGLRGIEERAAALGGTSQAKRREGGGFEVRVAVPLTPR